MLDLYWFLDILNYFFLLEITILLALCCCQAFLLLLFHLNGMFQNPPGPVSTIHNRLFMWFTLWSHVLLLIRHQRIVYESRLLTIAWELWNVSIRVEGPQWETHFHLWLQKNALVSKWNFKKIISKLNFQKLINRKSRPCIMNVVCLEIKYFFLKTD